MAETIRKGAAPESDGRRSIAFRVSEAEYQEIAGYAAADARSLASLVYVVVREYLERRRESAA